jgi:hypothetical protein
MPLEQIGQPIIFYAFYTTNGLGTTGLTVTADVWEIVADGTATEIASAQAATEIGDGLYRYRVVGASVDAQAEYIAVFKCADTTVDQRHIPAIWVIGKDWVENVDLASSTLASQVWNYAVRTLTQSAAQVAEIVEGSVVSVYQYTTWSFSLTGLGDISDRTRLYFTAKGNLDDLDDDDATILQVEETDGLLYIGGADASSSDLATLVVDNETLGNITVTVDDSVTGLPNQHGLYDVKKVSATGTTVLTISTFEIKSAVTKVVV